MMHTKHKKAFSMLTAIVVIVLMAGLVAMVTNTAGKLVKETTIQYRAEQAALLAKSYTEFAILAIQGHGTPTTANNCLRTITGQIGGNTQVENGENYRVEVKIQYIGLRNNIANDVCPPTPSYSVTNKYSYGYQTNLLANDTNSNDISATIDVYVMYHDLELVGALGTAHVDNDTPWLTYHRRTIQKL